MSVVFLPDVLSPQADAVANTRIGQIISALTYLFNGSTWDRLRGGNALSNVARAAVALGGSITVRTPAAGKAIRLWWLHVTTSAATVLTVKLGTAVILELDFAGVGYQPIPLPPNGILGAANGALTVTTSAAVTLGASALVNEE